MPFLGVLKRYGYFLFSSFCPHGRSDRFQSRDKSVARARQESLNVVQLPSVSARTKADRKRSD